MIPDLEVKSVKSFIGMEGYGFNANLYYKGKKVALVVDEASGAPLIFWWEKSIGATATTLMDLASKLPSRLFEGLTIPYDLDMVVSELVDAYENKKRFNRLKKNNVLFQVDGKTYQVKHGGNPAEATSRVLAKHPEAVIL